MSVTYILYTFGPKAVKNIDTSLLQLGIRGSMWTPTVSIRKQLKGKQLVVEQNVFQNYAFLTTDSDICYLSTFIEEKGFGYFLCQVGSTTPYTLTAEELLWVRNMGSEIQQAVTKRPVIQRGSYVEITKGTFLGTIGYVTSVTKNSVIVETFVFGRMVPVTVTLDNIEKVEMPNEKEEKMSA